MVNYTPSIKNLIDQFAKLPGIGPKTAERLVFYLLRQKNPDLIDIATSYAEATFLVAWLDGRIVGTGALLPRSSEEAEIVRMSVKKENRRQGIGRRILQALDARARDQGFKRIILETTATWDEVIKFYLRFGFQITHAQDGDVYFKMELV